MNSTIITLRYGNTNTFLIRGQQGGLLIDTDYAGTMPALYKALKANGVQLKDIRYVLATHYHPDHCGLIGELQRQGVTLIAARSQLGAFHDADRIFRRDGLDYTPVDDSRARIFAPEEGRGILKELGIDGTIVLTSSHSPDGLAVILDDGSCFIGDLEPAEFIPLYGEDSPLNADWAVIMRHRPGKIYYAHAPAREMRT